MKKTLYLLVLTACVRNQGSALQLRDMVVPTPPMCTIDAAGTLVRSGGVRDLAIAPLAGYGYFGTPRMFNNLQPTAEEPVRVGPRQNVRNEQNVLSLKGFNVCYEFQNAGIPAVEAERYPECEDLGGASFIEVAGGAVQVNGALAVLVDLFPPRLTANGTDPRFLVNAGDPVKTIIVHVQAVSFTLDGRQIVSNEMLFPVDVCFGCLVGSPLLLLDGRGGAACSTGTLTENLCVRGSDGLTTCEQEN